MVVSVASSLAKALSTAPSRELVLRVRSAARHGEVVRISTDKCTIGAGSDCTLRLRAAGVDPVHCTVVQSDRGAMIRCLSQNTLLNGSAFEVAPLRAGDLLAIGPLEFDVVAVGQSAPSGGTPSLIDTPDVPTAAVFESAELPVAAVADVEPEFAPHQPPEDTPGNGGHPTPALPTVDDSPCPPGQPAPLPPPVDRRNDRRRQTKAWFGTQMQAPKDPSQVTSEVAIQAQRLREETERLSAARGVLERESDRLRQLASDRQEGLPTDDATSILALLGLDQDQLARQHAELQQQLAELDTKKAYLDSLKDQLESLRSAVEQQQAQLHEGHLDLDDRRAELEKQHDELAEFQQQLDRRTDELRQLQSMLEAEQAEHELRQNAAEQEAIERRANLVASHDELQQARYDLETEREQRQQQKAELDEARQQWERRQAEEDRLLKDKAAEFEQRQTQLHEAQQQLQCDRAGFEAKQQELLQAQQAFQNQLAQQQETAKQQELAQQQQLAEQEQQLQEAREDLLAQKTEYETQQQTWEAERQEVQTLQAELTREQQEFEARKQDLEAQFQEIQAQREALETQHAELNSIRAELHRQRDELNEERAQVVEAINTTAVAEACGASEPESAPSAAYSATTDSITDMRPADFAEERLSEHSAADNGAILNSVLPDEREVDYERDETLAVQDTPGVAHGGPADNSANNLSDNLSVIEQLRAMALAAEEGAESCATGTNQQATWNAAAGPPVPQPATPQFEDRSVQSPEDTSAGCTGYVETGSESCDDADSIDAYMARLLNRVSGSSSNAFEDHDAAAPAASPAVPDVAAAEQPDSPPADYDTSYYDAEADDADTEPADPYLAPERHAPEQTVDIAAMRELANMSADNAISASTQSRISSAANGKVIVGTVAMAMGLVMFLLAKSVASIGFLAGLVAVVAALLWWFQAFVLWRRSKQRRVDSTRSTMSTEVSAEDDLSSDPNPHGDETPAPSSLPDRCGQENESEDCDEWIEVPSLN